MKKREIFMVKLRKEKKEKLLADKRRKIFADDDQSNQIFLKSVSVNIG